MNKKIRNILFSLVGIVILLTGIVSAVKTGIALEKNTDVIPPYGRIEIVGSNEAEGINYIDATSIKVKVFAKDDKCTNNQIEYCLSTTPITEMREDLIWKTYSEGIIETIEIPDSSAVSKVYAAFRDVEGNTSMIFLNDNQSLTITYDANGGINPPAAQTVSYGIPVNIPSQKPTYEGKMFVGWSEIKGTQLSDYEGYKIFKQEESISADSLGVDYTNLTLYAVWTEDVAELPRLADVVDIGDYVDYPVYYENVESSSSGLIPTLKGWRVLSIEDDGTVNLISAGVPLSYYHKNNSKISVENLMFKLLETPFSDSGDYTYRDSGFTPFMTLKEAFNNKYTAIYEEDTSVSYTTAFRTGEIVTYFGEKKAGDLKVHAFTKEEFDKIYDPTGETVTKANTYITAKKYSDLLALPTNSGDTTGNFGQYWFGTPYFGNYLWLVDKSGRIWDNNVGGKLGIRPVVSLKPTVKTTGMNIVGAWELEI